MIMYKNKNRVDTWNKRKEIIEEMIHDCTIAEIAKKLGIKPASVKYTMRKLGISRTEEERQRVAYERGILKAIEVCKQEKRRHELGIPQRTKLRFGNHKLMIGARRRLCRAHGYYRIDGYGCNIFDLYYDSQTKRLEPKRELYYHKVYGINFKQGDEWVAREENLQKKS